MGGSKSRTKAPYHARSCTCKEGIGWAPLGAAWERHCKSRSKTPSAQAKLW